MPGPIVCVLNEEEARLLITGGIAYKCRSRRHQHAAKTIVDALVAAGELVYVGKHKNLATFRDARSWRKKYLRNKRGEVVVCTMQLVRGGA